MNSIDLGRLNVLLSRGNLRFRSHQSEGISWCLEKERKGVLLDYGNGNKWLRGGVIADEMGLGKTFQILATMICNFVPHSLVVVPLILLDQWVSVFKTITGHSPFVYHGAVKRISLETLKSKPIVITTYGMISKTDGILHKIKWNRIVYDEAHHLRNSKTSISTGAQHLKSSIKWLITGTPIQNKVNDFYTLCDTLGLPTEYYKRKRNIPGLVKTFILRRTKSEVGIDLPRLNIYNRLVSWKSDEEKKLAQDLHSIVRLKPINEEDSETGSLSQSDSECSDSSDDFTMQPTALDARFEGAMPIVLFLKARQVCIFPRLLSATFKGVRDGGFETDESDWSVYREALTQSSKLDQVVSTILSRRDNDKKKLIFCHFKKEIDELVRRLSSLGFNLAVVDGRVSKSLRDSILTNKTLDILILQVQTACEGLNLQQFSEVYFVSPHWNPAVEDQAIARCHRMGQENTVDIFKFQMGAIEDTETETIIPTIENYVSGVQNRKRKLLTRLLNPEVDNVE
jgi:SNF2 family DNA or RNA helicase